VRFGFENSGTVRSRPSVKGLFPRIMLQVTAVEPQGSFPDGVPPDSPLTTAPAPFCP
jgi:hypothetical protein